MKTPANAEGPSLDRRTLLAVLAAVSAGPWSAACRSAAGPGGAGTDRISTDRFLRAVETGDITRVTDLLDQDATLVRATDPERRSAFVLSHLAGHPEIGALLKERGLELDVVEAVLDANWERVEALAAEHPETMNAAHPIGGSPLYASGLTGGGQQYRLRALGCDSNGRPPGGSGFTPARAAVECRDPIGAWLAATDILSNGGNINAVQANGDSILHAAVRRRDPRLVSLALRKGAETRALDDRRRTPLDLAAGWEAGLALLSEEALVPRDHRASRFAFNASREPFTLDALQEVPQSLQSEVTSVSHFNPARVRELLGTDPRLVHSISTDDELAIEACGHTGQREVMQIHLDHGAPLSLPTAISLGDLEHARWLLEQDPKLVHERGPHDFPMLWYPAVGGGSIEAAELLLNAGAPIEQESGGETGLYRAADRGHPQLVRYLLERGADPTAVGYRGDRAGRTPLGAALAREHTEVVKAFHDLDVRA